MNETRTVLSKGELALAALRRAVEKAQRQQVVTEHDLRQLTTQLEAAGLLNGVPSDADQEWTPILEADPNLALAIVRAELEKSMRRMLNELPEARDVQHVLLLLLKRNRLDETQFDALTATIAVLNSAVHGAVIDRSASAWARETGLRILARQSAQ
ncbi:MAG: hypothetical protein ACAH95_10170 [Fimbriimonas sp.]